MKDNETKTLDYFDTYFEMGGTFEDLSLETIVMIRLLEAKRKRLEKLN